MTDPTAGNENPHLVEAFYDALIHSNVPTVPVAERRMAEGKRWQISVSQRPLTTTQGTKYLYLENLTNESKAYNLEPFEVYAGARTIVNAYKNADVDTSTFNSVTISNLDSSSTNSPDANAFEGTANNVTVNSTGTIVGEAIVGSGGSGVGNDQFGTGRGRPVLYLASGDNILVELVNDSGSDVNVTMDTRFYTEVPDSPGFGT